jgi:predicted esterase
MTLSGAVVFSPILAYGQYWDTEVVDATTADVGLFTSIALDSNNNPHISYYDSTSGYLRYARYDGAAWHLENADMVHDVGRYSSLALDSANNPRISYYDATEDSLKYARWVPPVPAATPTPRYVELNVAGGPDFAAGATLTLNWEVHPDSYGFAGSPRDVYLGVILSPEGALENAAPSVPEVLGTSGTLMLFHPATSGPHAYPPTEPAWRNVRFPLASGNSGSLNFTVPANVGQRCVFVAGFSPFPVPDQCVTSNGFNLPPLSSPPTPVAPSGRSGAFYLPGNYTQQALPLLVAFHGTGGDGAGMVAGFQALADEYGFIIVAPDSGDPAVWWISEAGSESDDYPIIMDWVDYIRSYPGVTIDDDYVMTLGFSGGAPVAPYIATNDEQFTAFAAMHGEVWEPSIGPNLALAWLSTGADDWWTPAMFEGYADMLDGRGFSVTLNIYPGGHVVSAEEQRAAIDWWLR